jgi:hypothetical protein
MAPAAPGPFPSAGPAARFTYRSAPATKRDQDDCNETAIKFGARGADKGPLPASGGGVPPR